MKLITILLTALLCLSNIAVGQTVWTLTQDTKKTPAIQLDQVVLPAENSVPDGHILHTINVDQIGLVEDYVNADVAINRFHNKAIIYANNAFWSVDLDTEEITEIPVEGTWPFAFESPIRGIDIIYGVNGRPKWLLCVAWNEYSYIDMRSDPWTWGHAAWILPNGGYVVDDIEFCIQDRYPNGEEPYKVGMAYTVEFGGLITVWNPIEAIKGRAAEPVTYYAGTGQFGSRLVFDTSSPTNIAFSQAGTRDLSGRLYALDQEFILKDVNHTGKGLFELNMTGELLGLDFSPAPINLVEFTKFESVGAPNVGIRFQGVSDQPLLEVRPDSHNNLLLTSLPFKGTPHLIYSINKERVHYNDDSQIYRNKFTTKNNWVKATFNPRRGEYQVSLGDILPLSPLPPDTTIYIYAQWAYIPETTEGYVSRSRILLSDPVLIPVSNVQ